MREQKPRAGAGRPLAAKLGLDADQRALLIGVPPPLLSVFQAIGFASLHRVDEDRVPARGPAIDYAHLFAREASRLATIVPLIRRRLAPAGMLWVSWPKRAAKLETDLSDSVVRETVLVHGLVDVKVCAVDATWSGLKFVIPVKDR